MRWKWSKNAIGTIEMIFKFQKVTKIFTRNSVKFLKNFKLIFI
jgi:hypothetical protein